MDKDILTFLCFVVWLIIISLFVEHKKKKIYWVNYVGMTLLVIMLSSISIDLLTGNLFVETSEYIMRTFLYIFILGFLGVYLILKESKKKK